MSKLFRFSQMTKYSVLPSISKRGQRAAARNFSIDHSMISRWEKHEDKLKSANGKN